MALWAAYEVALARRPILLKSGVNGVLAFAGDLVTQTTEQGGLMAGEYDSSRGFALTSLALAWGSYIHFYLNALEWKWPQAAGLRALVQKIAFNQFVHNPFVYLPIFFTYTGLIRGKTLPEVRDHARREWWNTLVKTWAVFIPVNVVSFTLMPPRHQATLNAAAGFVYAVVLSVAASRADRRKSAEREL